MCMKFLITSILFFTLITQTNAQRGPVEFGNVTLSDFQPLNLADTSASAIVLFEKGEAVVWASSGTTTLYRHVRVRIIDKRAIDTWGNGRIVSKKLKPSKLKGATYNLVNGKVQRTDLTDKYVLDGRFDEMTFSMPAVREGSIIEYSYTIDFGGFLLPSWTFQHSIPTLWSEYSLRFPFSQSLLYSNGFRIGIYGDYEFAHHEVKDEGEFNRWVMKNLPAFNAEPQMPNEDFYKARIDFGIKLSSYGIAIPDVKHWKTEDLIESRELKSKRMKISTNADFTLDTLGTIRGKVKFKSYGYASDFMRDLYEKEGKEKYQNPFLPDIFIVDKKELLNIEDSTINVSESYDVHISGYTTNSGASIYLNPFHLLIDFNSPFKEEKRKYPVDFKNQFENIFVGSIRI